MELRVLHYFLQVARCKNITKAASLLHLTQPTLSRQLMALEEELQTPLFIRDKRTLELTEEGILLQRRAEEILSLVDKTEQEIKCNEGIRGNVVIGSGIFHASIHTLPLMMEEFMQLYPEVTYDIYTANADLVKERIEAGLMDIGLVIEPVNIEGYHFIRLPIQETWGIVVQENDALASLESVQAEDLKNYDIFISNRDTVQQEIRNLYHLDIVPKMTYNFISNMIPYIKKGLGIGICVEGAFEAVNHEGIQFIPFAGHNKKSVLIIWKKHDKMPKHLQKLIDFLSNYQFLQ